MFKPISALDGQVFDGAVTVTEQGLRGMIMLRGDLGNRALRKACTGLTGVAFPEKGQAASHGAMGLAWMSPDEVLVMVDYADVGDSLKTLAKALKGHHHLMVDVSDARAFFALEGPFLREVLAKLAPVDLHPDAFGPGDFRRTRLGQIAAAFWMRTDGAVEVICFRSVAGYAMGLLSASVEGGPVKHFPKT